jgi:peptidyl-dipeptidase Dcp
MPDTTTISPEDVTIRCTYQDGDLGSIIQLHGIYKFGLQFELYVAQTLIDYYGSMDPTKERVWIAELKGGKIIGSLVLKNTNGWAQLRYFVIDPHYRGVGLGKRLLDTFMAFVNEVGCYKRSFLLTEKSCQAAVHLYTKYCGYKYISELMSDSSGLTEQRYEMDFADES